MAYIGKIGKRITIKATYRKCFEYTDYKFSYCGTTHFTHIFEDADGNAIVWKSTNPVEYIENEECKFIPKGSVVELTGSVKEHSEYKGTDQTIVTRCKFKLIERAKTAVEIEQEKAEEQRASIGVNDMVWEMPYRQYKDHYSDCETVIGSYNAHTNSRGVPHGVPTIKVIIREGRLKASGVRGKHYKGFEFTDDTGMKICYRAISEETARRRMKKEYPNSDHWKCTNIYNYHAVESIW